MEGTVIIADDDTTIRTVLSQAFIRAGCRVKATGTISTLWGWIEDGDGDILITDVVLPDGDALDILPALKKKRPEMPIVVMSALNNIVTAIRATDSGAYEYLPKPFDLSALLSLVHKLLEKGHGVQNSIAPKKSLNFDKENLPDKLPLIGGSKRMQEVYRIVARLVNTDLGVIVVGASGTGKELVARALHDFGPRRLKPFLTVNLASMSENLVEEELFGSTGDNFKSSGSIGKFEQGEGGTLFLDEVGDVPLSSQARLLRVLQDGEFSKVGSNLPLKSNVRIISATQYNLRDLINIGKFREDLFFRLNVVPIRLPLLRERVEDIPDLVQHFLNLSVTQGLSKKKISAKAIGVLKEQAWSGNVRELENFIQRLVVLCADELIDVAFVTHQLKLLTPRSDLDVMPNDTLGVSIEKHLKRYFELHGNALPPKGLYGRILKEVELPLIALALSAAKGNQLKTAKLLGINRNTLRKKINELDISVSRGKNLL